MGAIIDLGEFVAEVTLKDIKNVHLSVYPPTGQVRISAPLRMNLDTIRVFAISKLGWIKQQQKKHKEQLRETPREYLDRESHYVWGQRYLLEVSEAEAPPGVNLSHSQMHLRIRPGTKGEKKHAVVSEWYRAQLKEAARPLIAKWEPRIGVRVERFFVQQMKTRWGSANPAARTIRLNTELAKKPPECLAFIIVHEMTHFLVPNHGARFIELMNYHMPNWRQIRQRLNEAPLSHVEWDY